MNKELQATQTEQQLIEVIGVHILSRLARQRVHLAAEDIQTFDYLSDQLRVFIFQSELAYSFVFPLVGSFLKNVRHLPIEITYFYSDDALIKHDEYVSKVQSLIKESLNTLDINKDTCIREVA